MLNKNLMNYQLSSEGKMLADIEDIRKFTVFFVFFSVR